MKVRFAVTSREDGYQKTITGEIAAPNVAIHRPPFTAFSKRWALSIVSTGKSIGLFEDKRDAVNFAAQAVATTPELKELDPQLRPDQMAALVELRAALRGTKF